MATRALAVLVVSIQSNFWSRCRGLNFNYWDSLAKVTKYFIVFYCYFLFLFNCVCSVGESACRNFSSFMRNSILYEPNLKIERTFRLRRKKQRMKNKGAREEGIQQTWREEKVNKEGRFVIPLLLESKGSPQASLALMLMPTISSSNRHSFPWCNNLSLEELTWKTQIYTSRPL